MDEPLQQARSDKLSVFISCSRDDLAFADQLAAALEDCNFAPMIDRSGISGGEDWQRRLGNLIRESDTVAFVLSPSSIRSKVCAWELEEAVTLSKRIIPVVCLPLDGASPPRQLADLNYIYFYSEPNAPGSGFGTGLGRLITALNTNLDWVREHTRVLQRASEWEAGGRPANRLLSGSDIATAKHWVGRRPRDAPEPTPLQRDFIRASEIKEELELRKQLVEASRISRDRITLSAFSPRRVRPWSTVLIQAYVHEPLQIEQVRDSARERDPNTSGVGSQASHEASYGDQIRVRLLAEKLKIDEPIQDMNWTGSPLCAAFSVRVPLFNWRREYALCLTVEVNGVPTGRLKFLLHVDRRAPRFSLPDALPLFAPYRRVFISYSSEDRHFVLEKVRALEEADIQCFFDVESLRSGDHWERKLKENIASSDLVMLFWSPAAAASKWVMREARWALELQKSSPIAEPDIKPYHVTGQRTAPPPPELAHLHFASAGGVATHSFVKTSA